MRLALLAVLVTGCVDGDETPRAHQGEALHALWLDVFRAPGDPPVIYWRAPDCGAPAVYPDFQADHDGIEAGGVCYGGYHNRGRVVLPWLGKLHRSGFVHELIHAWLWNRDGYSDPDHDGEEWMRVDESGPVGESIERAADALLVSHGW
jgi:hypothetical protein